VFLSQSNLALSLDVAIIVSVAYKICLARRENSA
jgi:hypothetical protein